MRLPEAVQPAAVLNEMIVRPAGWLEARDVFNTRPLGQVEKALVGNR